MQEEPANPDLEDPSARSIRAAWASGRGPAALGPALTARILADEAALAEVLAADAEERWDRGERATVESYLAVVPELKARPEACRALLMCELARREDRGDPSVADRLKARLPELSEEIEIVVGFFQAFGSEGVRPSEGALSPGDRLGAYELRERLGRGSFGEVWRAWDTALERQVALKLLPEPPGGEAEVVLAEARAAAGLDHDHIVRVHSAGRFAQTGLLYIDAQLVADPAPTPEDTSAVRVGRSLEEAAVGAGGMRAREAARVMEAVCRAVSAAHARGVTHGDIKPGNILVTPGGRPMVADFGLAVFAPRGVDGASATHTVSIERDGKRITGTPAYMSPEQATGERAAPLSDIYSLGATLAAILTGHAPFRPRPGSTGASLDVIEQVREEGPDLSPVRAIDATLGAICARAMLREAASRYEAAEQMGEDLRAWLGRRPTRARALSPPARLALWARRHAIGVAAGALVLAALGATSAWYVASITRAEARALAEADKFESVSRFLTGMLEAGDPARAQGEEVTVREKLDEASRQLMLRPPASAEVAAALHGVVGGTYMGLGRHSEAAAHVERALELQRSLHTGDHADLAQALVRVGRLRFSESRPSEAEAAYAEAVGMLARLGGRESVACADAEHELAGLYLNLGRFAEAEPLIAHAHAVATRELAPGDSIRLSIANTRAGLLQAMGKSEEAAAAVSDLAAAMVEAKGPLHPGSLTMRMNHGIAISRIGRASEAEPIFRAALADAEAVVGPDHPITLNIMNGLARALERQEKLAEAEAIFRDALARAQAALGPKSAQSLELANNLAQNLRSQDRLPEAIAMFRDSVDAHAAAYGEDNFYTAMATGVLAMGLMDVGSDEADTEAEALLTRCMTVLDRTLPPAHPVVVRTLKCLETLYAPDRLDRPEQLGAVRARIAGAGG